MLWQRGAKLMRRLTSTQKSRAAECLAIAYSHLKAAKVLDAGGEHAAAIARLYYAAYFGSQVALADLGQRSKKHTYWISRFNMRFGRGRSWVPKSYAAMLNKLSELREEYDYRGSVPNDERHARSFVRRVENFLNKVRSNTPLLLYSEFIEEFLLKHISLLAVEFDYYCPKSYSHKDRIQLQVMSQNYNQAYAGIVKRAGVLAIQKLDSSRKTDYVLGWDNRFGQGSNSYLLFLDLDDHDEGKIKATLKKRPGWLFKSGEGYHFVGKDLINGRKMWLRRLEQAANSKALKPLVDGRHVEYSVLRGYSTLRISGSASKPFVPFMCWDNT